MDYVHVPDFGNWVAAEYVGQHACDIVSGRNQDKYPGSNMESATRKNADVEKQHGDLKKTSPSIVEYCGGEVKLVHRQEPL